MLAQAARVQQAEVIGTGHTLGPTAGKAREIKCKNGPTSQCASLCPDDSQEDITNALNYKNKCAAMDGTSHCDKYDDPADPQKACGASPASTF